MGPPAWETILPPSSPVRLAQGQHAAEQAQRAVQQQLSAQMARVAALEQALAEQVGGWAAGRFVGGGL